MRLKPDEIAAIKESAVEIMGEGVSISLFGSRVDDSKRGGDIDLYLEIPVENYSSMKRHLFLSRLMQRLGEQKIDVVINKIGSSHHLPIYDSAKREGIVL